jgi:hypothetical protein
MFVPVLSVLM